MATTIPQPSVPNISSIIGGLNIGSDHKLRPMKTGKSKSWIGEYYWVQTPVTEKNKDDNITEQATEWCSKQFGKSGSRWYENLGKFFFKDDRDMTLFILRWS